MSDPIGLARGLTNYGDRDFALYLRRSFAKSMGYSQDMLAKPVIGIANTASGFNNCHRWCRSCRRGARAGGGGRGAGVPGDLAGEVFLIPTSLMFRNLMAMDTEEMIRAQPMDAVVLVGGCDKTVPGAAQFAVCNFISDSVRRAYDIKISFENADALKEVERFTILTRLTGSGRSISTK